MFRDIADRFRTVSDVFAAIGDHAKIDFAKTLDLWESGGVRLIGKTDGGKAVYSFHCPEWVESYVGDNEKKLKDCLPIVVNGPENESYVCALTVSTATIHPVARVLESGRGRSTIFVKQTDAERYAAELKAVTDVYTDTIGECPFTDAELIQRVRDPMNERWGGFKTVWKSALERMKP